ncbi:AT-hook motif nuclear-localized protein 1 [Ananas comosus]|uniref:AT-hook motif nuclear-localized protein n=1 Tax=Ananas comosus TaxID=4615 RepID=A0A199V8Q6_ANACO|nr:AT-hook motif nuclear-localized protein 1 [Ananas comosus]
MEGREGGITPAAAAAAAAAEGGGSYQPSPPPPPPAPAPAPPAAEKAENASHDAAAPAAAAAVAAAVVGGGGAGAGGGLKKKRGRPRKYGPDGSLLRPLNPTPISASVPGGEYTPAAAVGAAMKRGRGRPVGFMSKHQHHHHQQHRGFHSDSLGEMVACSAGANFTPHIITVAAGEDVTMKIISFSQQGPRAICILSANGVISNVTLRQPDSSGGTLTYEGRFELLSLSGSFMPTENGGTRSRSGGISVSLASPDGRVVGGGVAGLLVAASPVQVVVGSFLPSYQLEQKAKKPRLDRVPASTPTSAPAPISAADMEETYSSGQGPPRSSAPSKFTITTSFRGDNWSSPLQSVPDSRNSATDVKISIPGA